MGRVSTSNGTRRAATKRLKNATHPTAKYPPNTTCISGYVITPISVVTKAATHNDPANIKRPTRLLIDKNVARLSSRKMGCTRAINKGPWIDDGTMRKNRNAMAKTEFVTAKTPTNPT